MVVLAFLDCDVDCQFGRFTRRRPTESPRPLSHRRTAANPEADSECSHHRFARNKRATLLKRAARCPELSHVTILFDRHTFGESLQLTLENDRKSQGRCNQCVQTSFAIDARSNGWGSLLTYICPQAVLERLLSATAVDIFQPPESE